MSAHSSTEAVQNIGLVSGQRSESTSTVPGALLIEFLRGLQIVQLLNLILSDNL